MKQVAAIALVAALVGCADEAPRPNILLVTLDTTRADRIGAYGYADAKTPVLDALAERGVVFEEAYSPAPMTLPAHATIMTGLQPPEHGARVNGMHELAADVPTLAERLANGGYRTGAFIAALVLDRKFGLARGFEHYDDDLSEAYARGASDQLAMYRAGDLVVDSALEWLASANDARPFFAWVHLYDPHVPWRLHGKARSFPLPRTYDREIAFVDKQVGRLVAYLDDNALRDTTLVMAVADHGEGLEDHHELEHGYLLNEEVMRVPWIVAGPGVERGHRATALVSLADVAATTLDMIGLARGGIGGRSLAPALRGVDMPSVPAYGETELPWTSFRWAPQRSLTTTDWKYVRTPDTELYDRAADRGETNNLARAKPEVVAELEARLVALEAAFTRRESDASAATEEDLERLAALGYAAGTDAASPEEAKDIAALADIKARLFVKDLASELTQRLRELTPAEHRALAQRLVELSPETPSFHNQLGNAFVRSGDFERAIPALERTVELAPTSAGAHEALGAALERCGRVPKARAHAELALDLDPNLNSALVLMARVLLRESRVDEAEATLGRVLNANPEHVRARVELSRVALARGDEALALEHLERAVSAAPDDSEPAWRLAFLLATSSDDGLLDGERAVELALRAVARDPRPASLDALAAAYAAVGQFDDARGTLGRVRASVRAAGRADLRPRLDARDAAYANKRPLRGDTPIDRIGS